MLANGEAVANDFANRSVDEVVALIRIEMAKVASGLVGLRSPASLDPARIERFVREKGPMILAQLSPADQARLMKLVPQLAAKLKRDPELLQMIGTLTKLNDDAIVAWIQSNLDAIEERVAS